MIALLLVALLSLVLGLFALRRVRQRRLPHRRTQAFNQRRRIRRMIERQYYLRTGRRMSSRTWVRVRKARARGYTKHPRSFAGFFLSALWEAQ